MAYTNINEILKALEGNSSISDIHIAGNSPVVFRSIGEMHTDTTLPVPSNQDVHIMTKEMLKDYIGGWEKLMTNREIDFSIYSEGGVPYRVNAYYSLKSLSLAMRKISNKPLPLDVLMYDDVAQSVIKHVLNQKTGIFLVTGPTGSGKTTSLIAMLEWLNIQRKEHIITIEDPIEYIFESKNCMVSQRELGTDTVSFELAMKGAMRQDPDIIFVGEIRDPETADTALKMAETGHLVLSTLHTRNAADTVYRFISLFPPEIQDNARDRLAAGLLGIQSQFLLKRADGAGRVGLYELMLNNVAIKNDIRKNNGKQINSIIETSRQSGMISHIEYAKRLIAEGLITKASVDWLFD